MSGWQRVSATSSSNSSNKSQTIDCPAGKKLLGGGGSISLSGNVAITASNPVDDDTWSVTAAEVNTENSSWTVTAYAICGVVT